MAISHRCLCLLLICLFGTPAAMVRADDAVIRLKNNDAEMEVAKAKARSTLPRFWANLQAPAANEERFSLKVEMPYGPTDAEHLWVTNVERKNGKIRATVSNQPKYVQYVRLGQRIEFEEGQISDWTYRRNGKIVGNYTMRALLPHMPHTEAARYRAMLEEP